MKPGDLVRILYKNLGIGIIVNKNDDDYSNAYNVLLSTGEIKTFDDYWLTILKRP